MHLEQNKALIQRYYAALWNQWNLALADDFIAEDIVFQGSLGIKVVGREAFKEYVQVVRRAFPDFHNRIEELLAEGDQVVARLTHTGTHRGELFGLGPTGQRVHYAGVAIFTITEAKIVAGWVLGDLRGLMEQLNADGLPPNAPSLVQSCPSGSTAVDRCVHEQSISTAQLRPTMRSDLDFVLEAEQDLDNARCILPWTRDQHVHAITDPDFAHRIIELDGGRRVGFVLMSGLTSPHHSIEFRRIVVTAKGQGLGRAAVRAVKRFAFVERGAHRLWLDVKPFNQRARRLYESERFVVEGVLRECLKGETAFDSLVVMSMLASEYGPAGPAVATARAARSGGGVCRSR